MSVEENSGKKFVKIGPIGLTREFVILMMALVVVIGIMMYNPYELRNVLVEIQKVAEQSNSIAKQNNDLAEINVNNTQQIINNSANRFALQYERLSEFINTVEEERQASGVDVINVLFLYIEDLERDITKLMAKENITNNYFVRNNGTHIVTESGVFELPYPLNETSTLANRSG